MLTASDLIDFENKIRAQWEAGELPTLLHLCGGNEEQLLAIFADIRPQDWVFSSHRSHYHALLKGIPPSEVCAAIMRGDSMFLYSAAHRFFTSAILAGTCGIAAGIAAAIKRRGGKEKVWCFLGDGAEEQGHFYEAALLVEAHDLPCTFIIEDNQRQVDTDKVTRRGVNMRGGQAWRPLEKFKCVERYYYTPTYPHAGSGCKFQITFKPEAIARLRSGSVLSPPSSVL